MSETQLDPIDAIRVATVLEDCVDQLAVLGHIMPTSFQFHPNAQKTVTGIPLSGTASSMLKRLMDYFVAVECQLKIWKYDSHDMVMKDEISQMTEHQSNLEDKFKDAISKKQHLKSSFKDDMKLQETEEEIGNAGRELKNSTRWLDHMVQQRPLTNDTIDKIQKDRGFVEAILLNTMTELANHRTFDSLVRAVSAVKEEKLSQQKIIQKEEDGRKKIKMLQKEIKRVKAEKESELQKRNEMVSHLKDQLQELKAKSIMEGKYVEKCANVSVAHIQKKCRLSEKELKDEVESLQDKIDLEHRANAEIESYLRTHTADLMKKQEHWMEKFEEDKDAKQRELDLLKVSKAKDLEKLQELTKLYKEYEQVVVEYRIEGEKLRRKQEQESIELLACLKMQSWWRGVMVRKGFGPYRPKKKKKKKGKKGQKGKKAKKR